MKKLFVFGALAALSASALAEGYVGASVGRGKLPFSCAEGANCKQTVNVFKLYAGTRLKEANRVDLGVGRIDSIEVAFLRNTNKATETTIVEQTYFFNDPINGPSVLVRDVPSRRLLSLDALVLAPVLNFGVADNTSLFVKAGAAVVTATIKSTLNGVSMKSESKTKLQPYVGFGASYNVVPSVKVFGASDWFRYSTEGASGTARALSVGAEVAF